MIKIAHFADVHIHNLQRHDEYRIQFNKIYTKLREQKPDRIVISGDLFEKFVEITNEAQTLAGDFLNEMASIAKVIIDPGNHDFMKKNKNRINSVFTIVNLIKNPNITYFGKSGFFNDDNIVWVNYSHLEKNISPWVDIPHVKDESKIYIALYHDPINDSSTDTGQVFSGSRLKSIKEFSDNDFVMFGDIHKLQYFRKNKSAAYCGSTIQQDFGEKPDSGHGYILWDIEDRNNFTSEHIDIPNDHTYINFYIDRDVDYDNLDFSHPLLTKESEIKINWIDLSANINFINELKIRDYFKNTYDLIGIKIERNRIFTDVSDVEMVNESINVLDPESQRKIFDEYLKLNGYSEEFIEKILDIDTIITDRLQLDNNNMGISWSIDKLWFDNFKSYADDNVIDFKNMGNNIIMQLSGENQHGKTTILDAISYVLYGTTTTTQKRQKNGDNRYINNKRDEDYVSGGAQISVNDKIFTLVRKTERKWNKQHTEITSCSTTLDYYKGTQLTEDNKLTEEDKNFTQTFIESAIGNFDDFIRLVLTTADNLNDLLSMDRAVFIDSIIRDAGYDIFEKKLEEFKSYRKIISKDDIKIDLNQFKKDLEEKIISKEEKIEEKNIVSNDITKLYEEKPELQTQKENLISSLEKIDEKISNINLDDIIEKVSLEKEKIDTRKSQLKKIDEIKSEILLYNPDIIKNKKIQYNEIKDFISDNSIKVSEFTNSITIIKGDINTISMDITNIISEHIQYIENECKNNDIELSKIKDNFNSIVIDYSGVLKDDLNNIITQKDNYKKDIDTLMANGDKLKKLNEELETSKICIMCERPLDGVNPSVINNKVEANKSEMVSIMNDIKSIKPKYEELSKSIDDYKNKLDKLSKREYDFDDNLNSEYQNYLNKKEEINDINMEISRRVKLIKNGNIPSELQGKLKPSYDEKTTKNDKINEIDKIKSSLEKIIANKKDNLETLRSEIENLDIEDSKFQKKKEAINLEEKVKSDIERCENLINQYELDIKNYNSQLKNIENNKKINNDIISINSKISSLENDIKLKSDEKSEIESEIAVIGSDIIRIKKYIDTFEKQKIRNEIMDAYMKCVHRDGLPSFLLKKSIHIINQELNNILMGVDFNLFFDDELNLKLSHDIKIESSQNAIESSGMERTFSSLCLKMSLRSINTKSKPNFLIMDEITGKLTNKSVEIFTDLLDSIKKSVDKLIIIEHSHMINYDVLINVKRNELGISSLEIEQD